MSEFRAWVAQLQKMYDVSLIDYEDRTVGLKDSHGGIAIADFDSVVRMKSTGLFDKNGVEIFDKDIIKNKDGRLAIVKWHGTYASFVYVWLDELDKNKQDWQPLFLAYMKFEVVGNIYKNFDLLEG